MKKSAFVCLSLSIVSPWRHRHSVHPPFLIQTISACTMCEKKNLLLFLILISLTLMCDPCIYNIWILCKQFTYVVNLLYILKPLLEVLVIQNTGHHHRFQQQTEEGTTTAVWYEHATLSLSLSLSLQWTECCYQARCLHVRHSNGINVFTVLWQPIKKSMG